MAAGFGDIRVEERADWLMERIVATGTLVLSKVGGSRAGEVAAHRLLSSPSVSAEAITATLGARTKERCRGRRVLAVQDTTEVNFKGRAARRRGLGPGADGASPGFFIHPVIAVDLEDEAVIGLVDAEIWTRAAGRVGPRRARALEEKESARWLRGAETSAALLETAAEVTLCADREADVFELLAQAPEGLHLIVRAAQDRALAEGGTLKAALAAAPLLGCAVVKVAPRGPGDKGRLARVELRARRLEIVRPKKRAGAKEPRSVTPKSVMLWAVEAREIDPPAGKPALLWRLLTTHEAGSLGAALDVVGLYRLRWRIEQAFRALKSDGLGLEQSQVTEARRLFALAAMALGAAVRTIQIVDARDGGERPLDDVLDPSFAPVLAQISASLEGATARQKNPHKEGSLSFLSWVAARLGGWNCYYKPPGPKTMAAGWSRLAAMLAGYAFAGAAQNV